METEIILVFIMAIALRYVTPIFIFYYFFGSYIRNFLFLEPPDHEQTRKNISLYFGIFMTIIGMIAACIGDKESVMSINVIGIQIQQATIGVVMFVVGVFLIIKIATDKG